MEKTLHDYFYIKTGEEIKCYGSKDAIWLIEAANLHIEMKNDKKLDFSIPALDEFIYECMELFYENDLSDNLIFKLNEPLKNVRIQCLVENIENKLSAVHVANMPFNPHPLAFGAYMFSHVAYLEGFESLKRCYNKDCLKFFLGRPNAKWCSSSCGSKYRVNKMRRNKKASLPKQFI